MWSLQGMGNAGWIAALIFCACSAIRLARFNVQSVRDEGSFGAQSYFTGLPTPRRRGCYCCDAARLPVRPSNVPRSLGVGHDDRDLCQPDGQPAADTSIKYMRRRGGTGFWCGASSACSPAS